MYLKKWMLIPFLFSFINYSLAQTKPINDKDFFKSEEIIKVKLSTDLRGLMAEKKDLNYVDGNVIFIFPDSNRINSPVRIKPRGNFRKEKCKIASLTVDFKVDSTSALRKLGTLKLVGGCAFTPADEQYLLKEYLVYKIYNMLTDMSFRVRLLQIEYDDTKDKIKTFTQYGFVIEDVDDMAKRNQCKEKEGIRISPNSVNRAQGTMLFLFQYMIGNTDWSIPFYHNMKLIVDKKDTMSIPYPVAYDFDISGLVDPPYGGPPPDLGITKLTERLYRGYARTEEELDIVIKKYLEQEEAIYLLINNFSLLTTGNRKEMIRFLKEFFTEIKNKKLVKYTFIEHALEN